jgi:folate-dependent phosphoribosylglycinamide formyltransferase PurN
MKVVFITGSHPRHRHLAERLAATGALAGLVIERREAFEMPPPPGLPESTRGLFLRHFAERAAAEHRFFGSGDPPSPPGLRRLELERDDINGPAVHELLRAVAPDLLLSYGCHKLSPETLAAAPGEHWNIHGGLSPWYRGVGTHFWPSYLLEPQMTGMTVHDTTAAIDGGTIVHQVTGPLVRGDGLHDLACRTVAALGEHLGRLLQVAAAGPVVKKAQGSTGRLWRTTDWRPSHLHLIYDFYGNRVVDACLDGRIQAGALPRLHDQLAIAGQSV